MNKTDIIQFFDYCAPQWDDGMVRNEDVIKIILDNGGVLPGVNILDVACGTGVLIPDYLDRNVASVVGIDISPEMAKIARSKFNREDVTIICGDAETVVFDKQFDCVMVYNAFPHFQDPENLIKVLADVLKQGGRLSVAHGMSREKIDRHHKSAANKISMGLMEETELAEIFRPYFNVDVVISNDFMYQVAGTKR